MVMALTWAAETTMSKAPSIKTESEPMTCVYCKTHKNEHGAHVVGFSKVNWLCERHIHFTSLPCTTYQKAFELLIARKLDGS